MIKSYMPTQNEQSTAYSQSAMEKEENINLLRQEGYRITRQRLALLEVILENECVCCKEIYFQVHKKMPQIGIATIYRMINTLEEVGAIKRKNIYQIYPRENYRVKDCIVRSTEGEQFTLTEEELYRIMEAGMKSLGLAEGKTIQQIIAVK